MAKTPKPGSRTAQTRYDFANAAAERLAATKKVKDKATGALVNPRYSEYSKMDSARASAYADLKSKPAKKPVKKPGKR